MEYVYNSLKFYSVAIFLSNKLWYFVVVYIVLGSSVSCFFGKWNMIMVLNKY